MKLLKARVRWMEQWANHPEFELLVDKMPSHGKDSPLRYKAKKIGDGTLYYAELDGYVNFFYHSPRDQNGYGGSVFHITLEDGSTRDVHGPWSSNSMCVNEETNLACSECAMIDKDEDYERGHTFYASACTVDILKQAAKMCGVHLLKVTVINEKRSGYHSQQSSAEQVGSLGGRPDGDVYYLPSLSDGKPTKWTTPFSQPTPRLEKPIFHNDEKLIVECLV